MVEYMLPSKRGLISASIATETVAALFASGTTG